MGKCICWMGNPKVVMLADGFAGWECSHRWEKRRRGEQRREIGGVIVFKRCRRGRGESVVLLILAKTH